MSTQDEAEVPMLEGREERDTVHRRSQHFKPLSLLPLIALIFYDVSGGPFGIEVLSFLVPLPWLQTVYIYEKLVSFMSCCAAYL